ncbi:magnesium transporter [Vulcanibacillus modesticaldus]|uniref:Magnesium transporter MgtE n=1 Tax=Vulcanibacillus modesticaldus TaxID=337097 RepID=A0A1D2YTP8_9BACI|nr:magnesium transporter [Vulcanibacillus modesticaldus]OEF99031.1 magnesium transporter [Vulcanibacillus modesticaldus]
MVQQMTEDQILLLIIKYLKELKKEEFQNIIEELQPYDIAKLYKNLPSKHRYKFLLFLNPRQIAELIQELDIKLQHDVLHKLGIEKSSTVMDLMDNDDLADLLNELSVDKIQEYLTAMKTEESETVKNLMRFPPDTAGGIMTNRYVWIRIYYTVREAVDKFKLFAEYAESLYYLYVLDENKKLVGVVSYRDLLLADMDDKIEDIMFSRVISVPVDMDQEEVAKTIRKYDFIAIPVVDKENKMAGIITVDDLIDVVVEEANEDIEKLSASGKDIDFNTKSHVAAFRRLPWLIFLLFIGLISGSIISNFESTLNKVIALTYFMPMISGMSGNTGTQSLAVVVRGLASHDIDRKTIFNLVLRELGVGLIIGVINGSLIAAIAYFWQGNPMLGLVVGSSLFATLIIGTLAGTIIPLLLYRLKIDPAIASGPLITTLNDIFSLSVYFGMATIFMSHLL